MNCTYTGLDVIDTDHYFVIDSFTRTITSKNPQKDLLIQNDHNSERFTFEIPRFIEGRDVGKCNVIQVCYLNGRKSGVYTVDDLAVYPFVNDTLTCSWLISQNATSNVGPLVFMLRFAQINDDATVEYAWSTQTYDNVKIVESVESADLFEGEYVDVIQQWKNDVMAAMYDDVEDTVASQVDVAQITTNKNNISELVAEQATLAARMNAFSSLAEGSTTGDSEVIDIRVAYNGYTYDNAGTAVREQIANMIPGRNRVIASNITSGYYVTYENGWKEPAERYSFVSIPVRGGEKYYISNKNNVHTALFNGSQAVDNFVAGHLNAQYVTIPDTATLMTVSMLTEAFDAVEIYSKITSDDIFDGEITPEKLSSELTAYINKRVVVGPNGAYSSILEALADNRGDVEILVESGTYDISEEYKARYGENYFEEYTGYAGSGDEFDRGLFLFDGCKLIGMGEVTLTFDYRGSNTYVKKYFAPLNTSQNNVVDNINFVIGDGSCRYIIHDDFALQAGTNIFRNCTFSGSSYLTTSMGCGMGTANTYIIENCYFVNNNGIDIAYHNNVADGQSKLIIKNTYCTGSIRGAHYGTSTKKSKMIVSGCKARKISVVFGDEDNYPSENIELIAWNNEVEQ